jgi:hypothetical protein
MGESPEYRKTRDFRLSRYEQRRCKQYWDDNSGSHRSCETCKVSLMCVERCHGPTHSSHESAFAYPNHAAQARRAPWRYAASSKNIRRPCTKPRMVPNSIETGTLKIALLCCRNKQRWGSEHGGRGDEGRGQCCCL